ncbi:MAG: ATP-dependent helicase HrpB [Pseudomonadota bacterium]|nr:MAG: ATP-dependent helicase HrpB [Pseudomonadota bacterium]
MLPVDTVLPELLDALADRTTVLLQAPTGSGKTTRVPIALLAAPWRQERRILMLEPRRLAARSAARFMAARLGERTGQTIGYRTRLDSRISKTTQVEVVTEGILTRLIQSDPELPNYAAVIFDEFHERSLQADLGLALVRETQQALRENLRLVVMSATLDTAALATVLGPCPVVHAEGRSHPVAVHYRPASPRQRDRPETHMAACLLEALDRETGSALVFLPGMREMRRLAARLNGRLPDSVRLCLLHGQIDAAEQDAAIQPPPPGQRKVVLASAIAESSLTIEGIRIVIDAGLQRRARFDPNSGMARLVTERVSKASAEQRRGRAGRLEAGVCYRLWSEAEQTRLQAHTPPEILSADLAPVVLELAQWGVSDPARMTWLDPPPRAPWQQAAELLRQLGALDAHRRITPHGRAMLSLGLHPRLAHMVLVGREIGLARTAAELAGLLQERGGLHDSADIQLRLSRMRQAKRPTGALLRARKAADKLTGRESDTATCRQASGRLLAHAWPDRIARSRGKRGRFLLANGRGALLDEADPLAGEEWLVACELDGRAREARIFLAAAVDRTDLENDFAERIETLESADWDERRGTVVARRQRRLGALVFEQTELQQPDPEILQAGLLAAVRRKGLDTLPWTEAARQWQARAQLLHRLEPRHWPAFDGASLAESLDDWLLPWLAGTSRWSDLQSLDLVAMLQSRLGHRHLPEFDRLVPATLALPTGRAARLDYRADGGPVLAVKLQAMFGCADTPKVAGGRVPVTLHLLSPAGRPLAVTADLASFWQNAYGQVRKDMRGRYPKHPWPEDPLAADATERARPTRRGIDSDESTR